MGGKISSLEKLLTSSYRTLTDLARTIGTTHMAAEKTPGDTAVGAQEAVRVEAFDPARVRPWRFHNRSATGLDAESLDQLAESIRRDGQQHLGLARRLPPGGEHLVEAVYGVRRLEACRRLGIPWRAEVKDEGFPDARCAALMHSENEWSEGVSALENAVQWKSMLDSGVFESQSALADAIGFHRGTVSKAVRAVGALLGEEWIARHVRPVMHELSRRAAIRLADALLDGDRLELAQLRAQALVPGVLKAEQLYDALLGERKPQPETVFVRRGRSGGRAVVGARIERAPEGGWSVVVRPHEQSPAEMAELAEQVESMLAAETSAAGAVRLGRRLAALIDPDDAKAADRAWLEGCVYAAARASGLDWDRWRCMTVAEHLRSQRGGWERAVVRAVGGRDADPRGT